MKAHNQTGATIAAENLTVTARRWKLDESGAPTYEATEATILENASGLTNDSFEAGTTQENDATGQDWIGAHLVLEVTSAAGSDGPVVLYLERATDDGTNFDTDGDGVVIAVLEFDGAETKRRSPEL